MPSEAVSQDQRRTELPLTAAQGENGASVGFWITRMHISPL